MGVGTISLFKRQEKIKPEKEAEEGFIMISSKKIERAKRLILGLCSLVCVVSFSNCSMFKKVGRTMVDAASIAADTGVDIIPGAQKMKESISSKIKDRDEKAILELATRVAQAKFDEVDHNRLKYAPIAQKMALYFLEKTGNIQKNPADIPVNMAETRMVRELVGDKNPILRTIGKGYGPDQMNAFDVFLYTFTQLSDKVSDNDCVRVMKKLAESQGTCVDFPITFVVHKPEEQRKKIEELALKFGCDIQYSESIRKQEDILNDTKHYKELKDSILGIVCMQKKNKTLA